LARLLAVLAAGRAAWAWRMARTTTGRPPGVVTDDGVLLHTAGTGRADAPLTVVLVHGLASRHDEFDALRTGPGDPRGSCRCPAWPGRRGSTVGDVASVREAALGPRGER
jgi:pimeloyl-ACP methyl ester carboxylesterase